MKKNILIVATTVAAGIAYYFVRKRKLTKMNGYASLGSKPGHHMTDIFARTKEQAVK